MKYHIIQGLFLISGIIGCVTRVGWTLYYGEKPTRKDLTFTTRIKMIDQNMMTIPGVVGLVTLFYALLFFDFNHQA